MPTPNARFKIAAAQATPVFLNREATVDKACNLIAGASSNGASLVVFTESFIPAYPGWVWAVPAGEAGILNETVHRKAPQMIVDTENESDNAKTKLQVRPIRLGSLVERSAPLSYLSLAL